MKALLNLFETKYDYKNILAYVNLEKSSGMPRFMMFSLLLVQISRSILASCHTNRLQCLRTEKWTG